VDRRVIGGVKERRIKEEPLSIINFLITLRIQISYGTAKILKISPNIENIPKRPEFSVLL